MIKSITRFTSLSALFLIPLLPLLVVDSYFFPFITGKAFYFRILVEVAFMSWVILAFMDARYRPRLNSMTVAVSIFAVVTLIANSLGVNPIRSFWSNFERMEGWITIAHLWMFFVTASAMFGFSKLADGRGHNEDAKRWWGYWFNAFVVVGVAVACYAFAQIFGWAEVHQGSSRIDASLGNAAYMAVYMLMNAGFATYLFFEARKKGLKAASWSYGILALVFSFLIFETATRGTILGLILGIMLALFIYAVFAKKESKRSRYWAGGIIVFIILISGLFWLNRQASFVQKNEVLRRLASISISDVTTQARGYVWPMAITGFAERPVLGWGQENFNYVFNANYNPLMWAQEQWFDRAHNVFLDWLIASGLVGFIAYLSLYVIAVLTIWRSNLLFKEKCALSGLIAGYAIHNFFVFDNLASYMAFFALLAFIGSTLNSRGGEILAKKTASMEVVEYVVVPISIVILVLALYTLNIRVIKANTALITALGACNSQNADAGLFEKVFAMNVYPASQETREQLINCSGGVLRSSAIPAPTKQAFFLEAQKAINDQIEASPKDARMYVLGGQFLNSLGEYELSLPILEKAHALTPGKQAVDLELANDYINSGQTEKGISLLKEAYEADPTYPQARQSYAMGLIVTGKDKEATSLFGNDPAIFETEQAAVIYASPQVGEYGKALAIYAKLIAANPSDVNLKAHLAQVQYQAGMKSAAVATLRSVEKDHPEYKSQIEAAIKQINQ